MIEPVPPEQTTHTPEQIQRVVRVLLICSPFMFVGGYLLALVQGARWQDSLLIAVVALAGCLGAAGVYKLRGSKAVGDAQWLQIILRILLSLSRR